MVEEKLLKEILPFWEKLSKSEKEYMQESSRIETYKKGSVINRTDEGCRGAVFLLGGQIRTYIVSDEGREVTLYRLHRGDVCVLSASCLLDAIVFDVIIEAAEDTELVLVPSHTLHSVMEHNLHVELFLAKTANERFSDVMWTMQQILFMGADKRVAIFLWDEMTKTQKTTLAYTHDEVARMIGSAREVVTRIMKYFADEGVVKLSRGKIEIIDKEKLRKFV